MGIEKSDRAKQAFERGVEAAKDGKDMDDNYYKSFSSKYLYLSGCWEQGFASVKNKNK